MKRIQKLILSVSLLAVALVGNSTNIEASKEIVLENVTHEINNSSGQDLTQATQYTEIKSEITFKLPANTEEGDFTTIQIPSELYFANDITQTLSHRHTDGILYPFATMFVNSANNTVTLTYLSAVEQFSNITGEMFFSNRIQQSQVNDGDTLNLEFKYGNDSHVVGPIDYTFSGDSPNEVANKYNWFKQGSKRIIENEIRVNPTGDQYSRPIVRDELKANPDAITYDKSSLVIYKGDWNINASGVWQMGPRVEIYPNNTSAYPTPVVSFDDINNSFEIDFGDHTENGPIGRYIGEYKINYNTVANYDILPGEKVENYAAIYDETVLKHQGTVTTRMDSAGGSTAGYQYSVTLDKVDDQDKPLAGATFELIRDVSGEVVATVTMTSGTHVFNALLYDNYTLREVSAPSGYTISQAEYKITPQDFGNGTNFTIKAVNHKQSIITGTKTWVDNNNQTGNRPSEISLILKADGVEVTGVNPTWTKDGNVWTYEFKNLPQVNNGTPIVYSVEELAVNGYITTQDGFNLTNTLVESLTDVKGTKTWVDNNNQDGIRPESIILILKADGVEVAGATPNWVKNGNVWTYEYKNLPATNNGTPIIYTVEEQAVNGYSLTQNGLDLINTHTPSFTTIKGSKTWVDNNNQDGIRPESITLVLKANGIVVEDTLPTWVKNGNVWTYEYKDLAMYKDGKTVEYTIEEVPVSGYVLEQDGFNLTNTHISGTTSVSGTKIWVDNSNEKLLRPESITVRIYANGIEIENIRPNWTKLDNEWTYEFANLPKMNDGVAITYTISEDEVNEYETSYNGFDITNTLIVPVEIIPENELPSTGVAKNLVGPLLVALGLSMILYKRNKKEYR